MSRSLVLQQERLETLLKTPNENQRFFSNLTPSGGVRAAKIPNITWPDDSEDTVSCCRRESFEGNLFFIMVPIFWSLKIAFSCYSCLLPSCVIWTVVDTWLKCAALPNAVVEQLIENSLKG